jgi:hypothetical protein
MAVNEPLVTRQYSNNSSATVKGENVITKRKTPRFLGIYEHRKIVSYDSRFLGK